jgi:putative intracellular protease/amidase
MSHKASNIVNPQRPKRVAIVISNPAVSTTIGWPVGFWWAELTHPYFHFTEAGYQVGIFSPNGGRCQADAMSNPEDASQWQAEDVISRGYLHDAEFIKLVENTARVDEIDVDTYDALVVAGGQGPMFTFDTATNLHAKFVEFYEARKVTSALCHGVAILRYARLSNGEPLVNGKTLTGFANVEEDFSDQAVWDSGALPRDAHVMPWRIEDELKALGANYIQAGLWKGFAVRDGNLITGQQNFSGTETAALVIEALGR